MVVILLQEALIVPAQFLEKIISSDLFLFLEECLTNLFLSLVKETKLVKLKTIKWEAVVLELFLNCALFFSIIGLFEDL
jgi:hypothetical protein